MYPRSVHVLQADALFASALQRSDELSVSQIRQAITATLDGYGVAGCAGRVAQEFGDHPETAAARMRWARSAVAALDRQPLPGMRPVAAVGSAA
jgi:hypothetical protein